MANVVVSTSSGSLRGQVSARGVLAFKGVPYAAAPVGELRFRPPVPHAQWEGVREATKIGAICPQNGSMEAMLLGSDMPPQSEDCLFLNVWTPACDEATRPVMVWIHGGAYVTGSGSNPWYDGTDLASAGDVVIVTANYRVGSFGFTFVGDAGGERFAGSGNLGLLDQVAVLRWVKDNIANFGGDAGNVTIFGESAGGGSVVALLAMPSAAGLFHKAIAQSASFGQFRSRERALAAGQQLLTALGIDPSQPHELLERSTVEILAAQVAVEAWPDGITGYAPTPDGVVLPDDVLSAIDNGTAAPHVPVMFGSNLDEMRLFTAFDPANAALDEAAVRLRVSAEIGGADCDGLVDAYRAARPGATWGQIASTIGTEHTFHQPAIRAASARSDHGYPTWMYRFTWQSPAFGGVLGASHAMEIPFVFGTLGHPGATLLTGDAEDRNVVSAAMQRAWLAFAHLGNPGWARYATSDRQTMVFDRECAVQADPEGDLRTMWAEQ